MFSLEKTTEKKKCFRTKVSDLENEIQRLQRETDSFTEDNKQYFALSKAFVSI